MALKVIYFAHKIGFNAMEFDSYDNRLFNRLHSRIICYGDGKF